MSKIIKTNHFYMGMIQILILTFLLVNCVAHNISILSPIKVFLYQFFVWFVVGYAIVHVLRIQVNSFVDVVAFSYAFGGIASLIVYLIWMSLGLKLVLPYFTVIEIMAAIAYLCKKRARIEDYCVDKYSMILCLSFLFIYFCLSMCTVSFVNTMPNETGVSGYYVDWLFWAGNNIGFTKSFPADRFRQVGVPFAYHYFSSILMAQVSLCTGVNVNIISFYFSSILAGIMLVFSANYLASRILKDKWFVLILMLAVLFTDGSTVALTWHINICPFGFDYGYAYGMMTIAILAEMISNDRFKEMFLPSCIFIAMTTGSKGPVGFIVLTAYGIAGLSFLMRKKIKLGIISGFSWLGSFYLIYYVFIKYHAGNHSLGHRIQHIGGLGLNSLVTSTRWIAGLYNTLISDYRVQGDRVLIKLYAVWLYIYRANNIIAVFLLIAIVKIIYDLFKKRVDTLLCSLVTASITGIVLAIYTTQKGGSEMYFMMAIVPSAAIAGVYVLEKWKWNLKDRDGHSAILYKSVMFIVVCILGISISTFYNIIIPKVRQGIAVIRNRYTYEDYSYNCIDNIDYEAFVWLRDNTSEDTVFVMDTFANSYGVEAPMLAGVFSERYVWNEQKYVREDEAERRAAVVAGLVTDIENTLEIMKDEGVSYLVSLVSPEKNEYGATTDSLKEVFRNEHYIIYDIK